MFCEALLFCDSKEKYGNQFMPNSSVCNIVQFVTVWSEFRGVRGILVHYPREHRALSMSGDVIKKVFP